MTKYNIKNLYRFKRFILKNNEKKTKNTKHNFHNNNFNVFYDYNKFK